MRVDIIGGGPGGLFLAVLLRRYAIADDVRVFERNGPETTYGWGVVFPEGALDELGRVDPATHAAIVDAGTTWTPVDVRYRGSRTLVNGNRFHGVPRADLLAILRDTATGLGARVHHHHRVDSLADHAEADLVVGADGVNSMVRQTHQDVFRPNFEPSEFRYAWYGVDKVFPYFTYIFRDTEWGRFHGYCYPSGRSWSSMIIHVAEETWERAGFARLTEEESARRCEEIFAADLDGRAIRTNGAPWATFRQLDCATWHHGNVVLIGDAAHTAHWSIGSGTRLAIEDAIVLADELRARTGGLEDALARFERTRMPRVEKFQRAARRSERYFENVHRYADFEPIQFVYQLVARSWRITHADIAARDPEFSARFDGWFHGRATGRPTELAPPPAFAPLRIGGLHLDNRLVSEAGTPGTLGGGLVLDPAREGADRAGAVDAAGAPTCRRLSPTDDPGSYREAARRALDDGCSMLMLDLCAEPWPELVADPPKRALEALEALRACWPSPRPLAVALGPDPAGPSPTEPGTLVALARQLAGHGADLLLLEAPGSAGEQSGVLPLADAVRNEAGIAVMVDDSLRTLDQIHTVLAAGWADLCVLRPASTEIRMES
ncbi:FAD-dependent monooxygenase [Kitasatospora sp. NPDC058444]|uniref:FAD-dependent monooxygenase n=1 Tax=Kitasatospora sp. NPDC058444 TaxID=3346504 RepID=UPI00365A27CF